MSSPTEPSRPVTTPSGGGGPLQRGASAAWRGGRAALRWALVDRVDITPVGRDGRCIMRAAAWGSIAFIWLIGWGWPTWLAVAVLCGYRQSPTTFDSSPDSVAVQLLAPYGIGFQVVVCLGAVALVRSFSDRPRRRPAWFGGIITVPLAFLVMGAAFIARDGVSTLLGLEQKDYPWTTLHGTPSTVLAGIDIGLAGPYEELALIALVVVALRRADVGWAWIYFVAVAVRIPFHLYYGWGAVAFAFWPVIFVYLYRRTGAIWGLVLAHALYDIGAFLDAYDIDDTATNAFWELSGFAAGVALFVRFGVPHLRRKV